MIAAQFEKTFEGWREAARKFLHTKTPPREIAWDEQSPLLFLDESESHPAQSPGSVPREFLKLAESVAYARDEDRWDLLYRLLFRLSFENRDLLKLVIDPDVARLYALDRSVRRDIHKMHAFVRFKAVETHGVATYVAWHRPEHRVLRPASAFFARRFGDRPWSIFTPDESAHWDLKDVRFGPGMEQHAFGIKDDWDDVWRTYYQSIFNPARIKIGAMKNEMPRKYWQSLPETQLIQELVRLSPARLQAMSDSQRQVAKVDPRWSLEELRRNASVCESCPLYKTATQTVFGEGASDARIMIVGEQPGDEEDLRGRPFAGPSGQLLDEALKEVGLDRPSLYVTNAVKHFKWIPRGKRRLHQKPNGTEMHTCKPWLEAEIAKIRPTVIIAMGTTAATSVLGRVPKMSEERGVIRTGMAIAPAIILTWHPSAILRAMNEGEKKIKQAELISDLKLAARAADSIGEHSGSRPL